MNSERTLARMGCSCVRVEERCVPMATNKGACCQEGQPSVRDERGSRVVQGESHRSSSDSCRVLSRHLSSQCGQSTVEYALVLVAFLSIAIAVAGVWHVSRSGRLLDRAVGACSHQIGGGDALGSWRDISLF